MRAKNIFWLLILLCFFIALANNAQSNYSEKQVKETLIFPALELTPKTIIKLIVSLTLIK